MKYTEVNMPEKILALFWTVYLVLIGLCLINGVDIFTGTIVAACGISLFLATFFTFRYRSTQKVIANGFKGWSELDPTFRSVSRISQNNHFLMKPGYH